MKLSFLLLSAHKAKFIRRRARPGCDPAKLGPYEIFGECKRDAGFNKDGLENRYNKCARKCKFGDFDPTNQVMCKCTRNRQTREFECNYVIKVEGERGGFRTPFDQIDDEGHYPDGGKQAGCMDPANYGEWSPWLEWEPCEAEGKRLCGKGKRKRRRSCSGDWCEGATEENYDPKSAWQTEEETCFGYETYEGDEAGHIPCSGFPKCFERDLKRWESCPRKGDFQDNTAMFNKGKYCVLPSFGGWPLANEVIDGENVEMGIECHGEDDEGELFAENMGNYWITSKGVPCKVVCRGDKGGKFAPKINHLTEFGKGYYTI